MDSFLKSLFLKSLFPEFYLVAQPFKSQSIASNRKYSIFLKKYSIHPICLFKCLRNTGQGGDSLWGIDSYNRIRQKPSKGGYHGEMKKEKLNGIDTEALKQVMDRFRRILHSARWNFKWPQPGRGQPSRKRWFKGMKSTAEGETGPYLCHWWTEGASGEDTAANPQEYLMGAMNACIMNTYVIGAAMKGIRLEKSRWKPKVNWTSGVSWNR